jgi:cytochrome b
LNTFKGAVVVVYAYAVYVVVSVGLTVWVGRTLARHGEVFLVDVFAGEPALAHAVNRLLVVGFYLLNLGYVAFALRIGGDVPDARSAVEQLSTKIGGVLLVLGVVHLGNVFVLSKVRRRRVLERQGRPPVPPDGYTPVSPWAAPAAPPHPA